MTTKSIFDRSDKWRICIVVLQGRDLKQLDLEGTFLGLRHENGK